MPTIEQPLQTLPLAHHRPPDWLHSYFNRSNEPICTRTVSATESSCTAMRSADEVVGKKKADRFKERPYGHG
jgi:hypothetical protein